MIDDERVKKRERERGTASHPAHIRSVSVSLEGAYEGRESARSHLVKEEKEMGL